MNLFLHAINAYNASTDPKDQIQYQDFSKFNGSHKKYESYLRVLLKNRVTIVDKRPGHNQTLFDAFGNKRHRPTAVAC